MPLKDFLYEDFKSKVIQDAKTQGLDLITTPFPGNTNTGYIKFEINNDPSLTTVLCLSQAKIDQYLKLKYESQHSSSLRDGRNQRNPHFRKPRHPMNLQFCRQVIVNYLNDPEKKDWRKCVVDEKQETEWTNDLKKVFT